MTHTPRILIAAQDQELCNFIQVTLAPHGLMLLFIAPEVAILDALAQTTANLVLLDTDSDDKFEQCRALKQHLRWQATPVLLLLHETSDDIIVRGHDAGADETLFFPGQPDELVRRVNALLQKSRDPHSSVLSGVGSPKKPMLRGFVHEVSNTLTSNMLMLATTFDHEKTLSVQNSEYLHKLFGLLEPQLSPELREEVLDYLHRIDQNEETLDRTLHLLNNVNERAISYTKQVSDYGKLEYLPMRLQPLMLDRELAVVVKQFQQQFDEYGIAVTISGVGTHPLFGHRPHVHSLFEHVLSNACEAFITQPTTTPARITITFSTLDTTQHVRIDDNAGGIQPIHLPEVFEPFYTTHPKTQAGLGLCFAAKLVSLYGGTIALESTPDAGTAVKIAFPINPPTTSPLSSRSSTPPIKKN